MKKVCTLLLGLLIMSACSQEQPKNYMTLSGQLENNKDTILTIASKKEVIKQININTAGAFKDTLKIETGAIYTIQTGNNRAAIYLKNGFNITLKGDAENLMKSLKFSGEGSDNSNFIIAQIEKSQSLGNPQLILDLEEALFKKKVDQLKFEYDSILTSYNNLDSTLYNSIHEQNNQLVTYFNNTYSKNKVMGKGILSPKFENYMDVKGGEKSLDSFKGKYVYIDVWATWCRPCIQQIPYLQTLEKEYHNKNIEFVSISTDESRRSGGSWEAAEKKWRGFIKKKNMTGVQLWSGQDYSFQQAYQINSIPRFILIDPEGKIVEANAARPSDPALKSLFTSLGI
ncbi:MAG: thiol-disulfide isomerase/thioredoxin [Porticoccaceae bacterium]|jgi:thiol-disulfide isomerase/thioredoxin